MLIERLDEEGEQEEQEGTPPPEENIEEQAEQIEDVVEIDPNKKYKNARGEVVEGEQLQGLTKGFYSKAEETASLREQMGNLQNEVETLRSQQQFAPQRQQPAQQQQEGFDLFGTEEETPSQPQAQSQEATQVLARGLSDLYEKTDQMNQNMEAIQQQSLAEQFLEKYPSATKEDYKAWQQARQSSDPEDLFLIQDHLAEMKAESKQKQQQQQEKQRRQEIRESQVVGESKSAREPTEEEEEVEGKQSALDSIRKKMRAKRWKV